MCILALHHLKTHLAILWEVRAAIVIITRHPPSAAEFLRVSRHMIVVKSWLVSRLLHRLVEGLSLLLQIHDFSLNKRPLLAMSFCTFNVCTTYLHLTIVIIVLNLLKHIKVV